MSVNTKPGAKSTDTKRIKVLLYGNVSPDVYRSQILIKFLIGSKYHISLMCPDFYSGRVGKKRSYLKAFAKKVRFPLIELLMKAAFADVIYLLPMNTKLIRSAVRVSSLLEKKLVVEPYISRYDTFVRDRKQIEDGTREAKEVIEQDVMALVKPDYIIHTANHELDYWKGILGINIDRKKVFISPLCNISTTLVHSREFMQDSVLRICWWGTFVPLHGLDNILQAMKVLQEEGVRFTCNLFGVNNSFFSIYTEKIQLNQLNQHVFLRKDLRFSDNSLPQYLVKNCDLALGIFGDVDKARNAAPNKLVEALSVRIPTLTMNSPSLAEFFDPKIDLWTCKPSSQSIVESILTIIEGRAYPVNWEQTRRKVQDKFSVAQYQAVVSTVLEKATDQ